MAKADSTQTEIPDLRIGSYRILQPLGLGGMSSVFRGVHIETGHEVALKVLPRALAKNPTLLQRFLREAKSAETLQHPNIVSIYDRGVDQGRHYLVLEYVPGGDFHEYVQRNGPLSVAESVSVIKQVARGLDYAASRGVIHRDIKPSNLLRTPSGQVKIIDLGLAIHSGNEDERVTREGTTVGTVDYMAPEQARDSRATTIRSDMYSLGCTFYYMLTGQAPFPGGDITDKLTRHAKSPPPDPQVIRPDVPDSVSRIVMRLLSKYPQDRFGSYEELISELDEIPRGDRKATASGSPASISLKELRDVDDIGPAPRTDSESFDLAAGSTVPSLVPSISLANLSADPKELTFRTNPSPSARLDSPPPRRQLPSGVISSLELTAEPGGESQPELAFPLELSRPALTRSEANWILGWVLTGAAAVLIVIGLDQLIRRSVVAPDVVPPPETNVALRPFGGVGTNTESLTSITRNVEDTTRRDRSRPRPEGLRIPGTGVNLRQSWVEPVDVAPELPRQKVYDSGMLAQYLPAWALQPIPESIGGTKVVVRRVSDSSDPNVVSTLRHGFDLARGDLEIAGDGPFLIDDFRLTGDSRLVRGRPGFRPILQVKPRELEALGEPTALINLAGKKLILDGLDFVVDLRDYRGKKLSLFQCSGAELTLRNCTITVVNPPGAGFSFLRTTVAPSGPSKLRLEGTFIRGDFGAMFDFDGLGDELVLDGTVAFGGNGPIVRVGRFDTTKGHMVSLIRSVVACRGPAIDLKGRIEPGQSRPLVMKLLGSALGRYNGAGIASVVSSSTPLESPTEAIDWFGEDNTYAGWKGYFAIGQEPRLLLGSIAELRSTWNETDMGSNEIVAGWRQPADLAFATMNDLKPFLIREAATLARVAQPRPFLFEKTIGSFEHPEIPEPIVSAFARMAPTGSAAGQSPGWPNPGSVSSPKPQPSKSRFPSMSIPLDLEFSTEDPEFHGDLGLFLARKISPDRRHARVVVRGAGKHIFTPVRLTDGLTLEVLVDPPVVSQKEWVSWSPPPEAGEQPLIDLVGGQILLAGLRINVEKDSPITRVIRVQDGHLVLSGCQFIRRDAGRLTDTALVEFLAPTSRPINFGSGLSLISPESDRPVCRLIGTVLITDGTALRAETGRGLTALSDCAIVAGQAVFELVPTRVSRHRFEADLSIDRCTIASDRDFVRSSGWAGTRPGPDRPWLISSSNSAYLTAFSRGADESLLFRGDEESLAHTDYFWEENNDALEVEYYMATSTTPSTAGRSRDVQLQWINVWGPGHVHRVTGPRLSNKTPTVRFLDKLQSGKVEPADLFLDTDYHPGRLELDVGAELSKLGISPKKPRPRGRRGST